MASEVTPCVQLHKLNYYYYYYNKMSGVTDSSCLSVSCWTSVAAVQSCVVTSRAKCGSLTNRLSLSFCIRHSNLSSSNWRTCIIINTTTTIIFVIGRRHPHPHHPHHHHHHHPHHPHHHHHHDHHHHHYNDKVFYLHSCGQKAG